jgi:hypothetical protein
VHLEGAGVATLETIDVELKIAASASSSCGYEIELKSTYLDFLIFFSAFFSLAVFAGSFFTFFFAS